MKVICTYKGVNEEKTARSNPYERSSRSRTQHWVLHRQ